MLLLEFATFLVALSLSEEVDNDECVVLEVRQYADVTAGCGQSFIDSNLLFALAAFSIPLFTADTTSADGAISALP